MTKPELIDREAEFLATVGAAVRSGVSTPDAISRALAVAQLRHEIALRSSSAGEILHDAIPGIRRQSGPPRGRSWFAGWAWKGIGASVAAAGLAAFALIALMTQHDRPKQAEPAKQYTTGTGEQLSVILSDGSVIKLAPQSSLTIDPGYGERARILLLQGEAFFEVHAQHETPFLVHTGTVSTRVLGTAFNVKQYPGDLAVHVAVVDGKVMSGGRLAPMILTAGMSGLVTDSSASTLRDDPRAVSAWRNGQLIFEDAPIPQVLDAVGRWYGYTFKLADSLLAKENVSAVFKIGARTETMKALQQLLDVRMVFDSTVVTLHPRQSTRHPGASAPGKRDRDTSVSPLVAEYGR